MTLKNSNAATVTRTAKTGQYVVRKSGGATSTHTVKSESSAAISKSVTKNRDALQRLANR